MPVNTKRQKISEVLQHQPYQQQEQYDPFAPMGDSTGIDTGMQDETPDATNTEVSHTV